MSKLSIINFFQKKQKNFISPNLLKVSPALNLKEGEQAVLVYTSATDKMKVFSAFIWEGLENGGAVWYTYPDEESETVRAKLRKYGIDVEKYEKDDTLHMLSQTESFKPNGKLDYEKAVSDGLNWWTWAKRKGYKSIRDIEDVGDFSFVDGQWQNYITNYWFDPRWEDPNVSEWVVSKGAVGAVYVPLLTAITAVNVEHMTETQLNELLKTFGKGTMTPRKFFIDLLENIDLFSESIGLDHEQLIGRKILLEFNPASEYEKVVDDLAKENSANFEPTFVFTSIKSPIHMRLAKQPAIKFFLTSISTSTPKSTSENEVLLPAKNLPLILDTLSKVLETYAHTNACFVFDTFSELLKATEQEKTFTFLRSALEILSAEKITALFLLNTNAHEPKMVSRTRVLFPNQLTYDEDELKIAKIS